MHPALIHWWKARQAGEYGAGCATASCGPGAQGGGGDRGWRHGPDERFAGGHGGDGDDLGSGAFGVRRPLRFLAYKLELDERQVGELARILDELKTERAQAEVDRRRTMSAFADAVGGEAFDEAKAKGGADLRVASAQRLRDAVTTALGRIHGLLDKDQREHLAYLIRTGTLQL